MSVVLVACLATVAMADGALEVPDYLSFTAKDGAVTIGIGVYGDATPPALETAMKPTGPWTVFTAGETAILLATGETVYFRRSEVEPITAINHSSSPDFTFWMDPQDEGSTVEAGGNVMSLLDRTCQSVTVGEFAFHSLFAGCKELTTAPRLPATNLAMGCYVAMFRFCDALTNSPALPAETLAEGCYVRMFLSCRALTTAPVLPATNLAASCYMQMFAGCSGMTNAPALPAMTLAEDCYLGMFNNCMALTTAPVLPATELTNRCYSSMFSSCKALTNAPVLSVTTLAPGCYSYMFSNCQALTDAPELSATTLVEDCYRGMFQGCTAITDAPVLSATTLATNCYFQMFQGCDALTNTPVLAATTLVDGCYSMMFDCSTNVNYLAVGFTNWLDNATESWLYNIAPSGTFVCPLELPVIADDSHIPEGWMTKKRFTLPTALPGMTYAVSNETSGAEAVKPTGGEPGGADYEVTVGDRIKIYCIPSPGYAVQGHNPLDLGDLNEGIVLDEGDHVLPKAILPPSAVWARCDTAGLPGFDPDDLPEGTYLVNGEILFAKCNESGAATFDFSALDATVFTGATIRFTDGEIAVDTLKFDPDYALRFVGGSDTILKGTADKSVFDGLVAPLPFFAARLSEPGPQLTVWSNLTFTCDAEVRPVWRNGGAIAIDAGGFVLDGCTFTDCFAEEFGGAVYAPLLVFDSMITNCVFDGSWVSAWNGYGGAIYVSAIHDGCVISVVDSRFTGNDAVNGGAICTVRAADDQEVPIRLDIVEAVFEGNTADYGGGAVFAEGAVTAMGSNTVFAGNSAGYLGGAICVNGIDGISVPVRVAVGQGAVFTDNVASNNHTWTAGGAIAVSTEGCTIDIAGALFATNRAVSAFAGGTALGGAVYAGDGCTNRFYGTRFIGNGIRAGGNACYGGAVSLSTGLQTIDTCVFDCRTPESDVNLYGGAVDFDVSDDVLIRNCTFRYAEVEAVSAYNVANIAVSNCVIVGNGLINAMVYPDVFFDLCDRVEMTYSAYGSIYTDTDLAVDAFNLSGRLTDIYADDTLRLRATGFNPVAALGLEQPGVSDIDDVPYGSLPCGTSMGAYETPTEPLRVTLDGSKNYDGNATSNGCEWTWKLSYTNGEETAWTDLVDPADDLRNELRKVFSITNWFFGDFNVGYYASTNATESTRIVAGVAGVDERVEWMRRVLEFVYTGTIRAALSEDLVLIFSPDEYAWTGEAISPTNEPDGEVTVIVSNTLTGAILVRGVDYDLDWRNNIDPTAAARLIVTGIANYADTVIVSNYLITAYCTKYFQNVDTANPVPYATTTNGALRGDAVVAAIDVPEGYCIDWQWPRHSGHDTNGVVYVFGQGGDGKEDILTLFVDYEKDENVPGGDDIPDKYQERVIFAVVNGWWNGERNGADKVGWVTLTNSVGQWAVNGTGLLNDVPGVGDKPFGMFERGEENGRWNQDLSITIDRTTFPIFLFSYGRTDGPVEDRGDKPFVNEMAMTKAASSAGFEGSIAITDFAVEGPSMVSGAAEAVVRDAASGSVLARTALDGRIVSVYGAESLEGPWVKISVQQTDAYGGWSVGRIRDNVYFKLAIESENTQISR